MPNPLVANGLTDEQLLLAGFQEICPLATLSAGEISVPLTGTVPAGRQQGCRCLRDIERVLPTMKSTSPPATIQAEPQGWSSTNPGADPVWVKVRHPDDPFSWGYWTNVTEQSPYEHRHRKPFWQTLAHEVCGHVWTYVRTRGRHSGGRGTNPRDHDPAIENENLIAGEHGVPRSEQRGFQHEQGNRPATRHAGESFLAATIDGYTHGSANLATTNGTRVIQSTADTVAQMPVFIELEGFAHGNEGGQAFGALRASMVMASMIATGRIPLIFTPRRSTQTAFRFRLLPGQLSSGTSRPGVASPGRKVNVFLFHNPRSEQHGILPAKVYFDTGSTAVRGVSLNVLDSIAAFLNANPSLRVELVGRADAAGHASFNLQLARLRAESVAQALLQRGVSANQIRQVISEGESRARAQSRATRWQDRHVEIRL
jgi:outer membrane protein OmpA-like peptidoglycan-associated protein